MPGDDVIQRRVRVGDLEVALDEAGEGPPVVLLHGGLGSRALWGPQIAALRGRYRVVAYDLRGHGDTRDDGARPESYGPPLLARDALALLDALGIASAAFVGLSVGGFAAQEVALGSPERVRALVLADTWARTGLREADRALGWLLAPVVEVGLRLVGTGPLERLTGRHFEPERTAERELMIRALRAVDRGDAVRVWRGLGEHDTLERLGGLSVPTLVIAGERDASASQARLMHRLIPDSELAILPGAGHVSNLHRPELFNAALRPFLDRVHAPVTGNDVAS